MMKMMIIIKKLFFQDLNQYLYINLFIKLSKVKKYILIIKL